MKKFKFSKQSIKTVTLNPGVYIYYNKPGDIIYIGKAKSLKNRIKSYLSKVNDIKTSKLVGNIDKFSVIEVNSEFEALLLEARLIKKHKPFYNLQLKDDKSSLYILITKDAYPQILTARKNDIQYKYKFGPFTNSREVKFVLSQIRKVFPFATHTPGKRKCFYSQINLCNPCPTAIEAKSGKSKNNLKKQYLSNIRYIKRILEGNIHILTKDIHRKINHFSAKEKYEKALIMKNKLNSLKYISQKSIPVQFFIDDPFYVYQKRYQQLEDLKKFLKLAGINIPDLKRIECYDISHMQGEGQSASMVVFVDGSPDKKLYRHFRIRHNRGNNDFLSMKETAKRRMGHLEDWGRPDLIIVDGGKAQVRAFDDSFIEETIPVVGIAKRFNRLIVKKDNQFKTYSVQNKNFLALIEWIRDESHRFAQRYHRKLLKKKIFTKE